MVEYQRRVVDAELDNLVSGGIPAISLEGAKAVGKSFTATQRVAKTFLLEQPVARQLLEADPNHLLTGDAVLVDEWQHVPATWGSYEQLSTPALIRDSSSLLDRRLPITRTPTVVRDESCVYAFDR